MLNERGFPFKIKNLACQLVYHLFAQEIVAFSCAGFCQTGLPVAQVRLLD
jgi:hypothetical protein